MSGVLITAALWTSAISFGFLLLVCVNGIFVEARRVPKSDGNVVFALGASAFCLFVTTASILALQS